MKITPFTDITSHVNIASYLPKNLLKISIETRRANPEITPINTPEITANISPVEVKDSNYTATVWRNTT